MCKLKACWSMLACHSTTRSSEDFVLAQKFRRMAAYVTHTQGITCRKLRERPHTFKNATCKLLVSRNTLRWCLAYQKRISNVWAACFEPMSNLSPTRRRMSTYLTCSGRPQNVFLTDSYHLIACWRRFYPNVTTLHSGLCYRNSVCRLSVCRLSSVTLVHPTQRVEPFSIFFHRCVPWPSSDLLAKSYGDHARGTPPSEPLSARGVSKYSDFGPIEGYIS